MIKKIMSILMTFTYCVFLPINTALAGSGTCSKDEKKPRPPKCEQKEYESKTHYIQKAFLVALLCAIGTDVDIKFYSYQNADVFTVSRIDDFNFNTSQSLNKKKQSKIILDFLKNKKDVIDFEVDLSAKNYIIRSVKINNCILLQSTINKIGKRVLELINKKTPKKTKNLRLTKQINLIQDASFKQEITDILKDVINSKNEGISPLNFFTLYSEFNFKKLDPIQNPIHLDYIQKYPEKSSDVAICYEKAFFIGIFSLFGIDAKITIDKNNPSDFIILNKINSNHIQGERGVKSYINSTVQHARSLLPPEKIKIEYQKTSYSIPTKIIINNNIILYENEILNIGQKFYNSCWKIIMKNPSLIPDESININHLPIFKEIMQNLLKEYPRK